MKKVLLIIAVALCSFVETANAKEWKCTTKWVGRNRPSTKTCDSEACVKSLTKKLGRDRYECTEISSEQ